MTKPENSLHFDGLDFNAAEEAEYEIEDIETQNQVRALLSNALDRFDDDDDDNDGDESQDIADSNVWSNAPSDLLDGEIHRESVLPQPSRTQQQGNYQIPTSTPLASSHLEQVQDFHNYFTEDGIHPQQPSDGNYRLTDDCYTVAVGGRTQIVADETGQQQYWNDGEIISVDQQQFEFNNVGHDQEGVSIDNAVGSDHNDNYNDVDQTVFDPASMQQGNDAEYAPEGLHLEQYGQAYMGFPQQIDQYGHGNEWLHNAYEQQNDSYDVVSAQFENHQLAQENQYRYATSQEEYSSANSQGAFLNSMPIGTDPATVNRNNTDHDPLSGYQVQYKRFSAGGGDVRSCESQPAEPESNEFPAQTGRVQFSDNFQAEQFNYNTKSPTIAVENGNLQKSVQYEIAPRNQAHNDINNEFLNQDGITDNRQMAQLQILYQARGRQIEELTKKLQNVEDESNRERRILEHRIRLVQGERDTMLDKLSQCEQELIKNDKLKIQNEGQIAALQLEINSIKTAKDEAIKKIMVAEASIESLNAQLSDVYSSESLSRTKHQHESIVSSMQQKFDFDLLLLKQKLDLAANEADTKDEQIAGLRKQLTETTKALENAHIDRADTINRLTHSLQESQNQCNKLIQAGTGQQLTELKLRVEDVIAGKSIAEDLNVSLQNEIKELKEQVLMYEAAAQYGILPSGCLPTPIGASTQLLADQIVMDDSYAQLGIKPVKAPASLKSVTTDASEETLSGLKSELERCLRMFRMKRQQVTALTNELQSTKTQLANVEAQLELAKEAVNDSCAGRSTDKTGKTTDNGHAVQIAELNRERELFFAALNRDHQSALTVLTSKYETQLAEQKQLHDAELAETLANTEAVWQKRFTERELEEKAERERIIRSADEQIEREIRKLEENLTSRQDETWRLKIANVEEECNHKLKEAASEKESIFSQLEEIRQQIGLVETKRNQELKDWRVQIGNSEEQIQLLAQQLQESRSSLQVSHAKIAELEQKFTNANAAAKKFEQQKIELVESYQKAEQEHSQAQKVHGQQIAELNEKLERAAKVAEEADVEFQKRLSAMRASLEHDHSLAIAAMQGKFVEKCREYSLAIENAERKHEVDLKQLKDRLQQQSRKQADVNDSAALQEMRGKYLQAVATIKNEVMRHTMETNKRNVEMLRERLLKERQMTAKKMRSYYLDCLSQLLDRQFDISFRDKAMNVMEKLLDNMPEQDSCVSPNDFSTPRFDCITPSQNGTVSLGLPNQSFQSTSSSRKPDDYLANTSSRMPKTSAPVSINKSRDDAENEGIGGSCHSSSRLNNSLNKDLSNEPVIRNKSAAPLLSTTHVGSTGVVATLNAGTTHNASQAQCISSTKNISKTPANGTNPVDSRWLNSADVHHGAIRSSSFPKLHQNLKTYPEHDKQRQTNSNVTVRHNDNSVPANLRGSLQGLNSTELRPGGSRLETRSVDPYIALRHGPAS